MTTHARLRPKSLRGPVMRAALATTLIASTCLIPLALWSTPVSSFIGLTMGLVAAVALSVFWRNRGDDILALVAVPNLLIVVCALGSLDMLWNLDMSHDLRTIGVVLVGWIGVLRPFVSAFRIARTGLYRRATKHLQGASLLLLLFVLITWVVSAGAFDGARPGPPTTYVYAVVVELALICFMTGILIVPLVLIRQERMQSDRV